MARPFPKRSARDIAAGLQQAVEEAVIRMAGKGENLCLAGGLGLNALLVSALENRSGFKNVFVQPVAGNAGTPSARSSTPGTASITRRSASP